MWKYLLNWKTLAVLAIVTLAVWWFTALISSLAKFAFLVLVIGFFAFVVGAFFDFIKNLIQK